MNKLDLRSFNKMSYEQMRYISDNAEICVDYMISDTHTPTEILCAKMEANLIYLSNLNKDSLEYIYSKFSWAIEILEFHDFNSEDDFYRKLKDTFDIDKDRVPDCIKEVLKAITDKVLHAKIYKEGEMVYKYNNDQIKFLELYPSEIEEISKLMNIQLENDTLRSIDMEEDATLMSFTTKFKDSLEADIKICTGDTNYFIDPVLYENGCEVAIMDCEGEFYEGKEFDFVYDNGIEYTVVVYNKLKNLEEDIKNALEKYDSDNIDIINDDSTSEIYLSYHSKNNSFPLGKTIIDYSKYIVKEVDNLFDNLDKLADKYYLGTQGI